MGLLDMLQQYVNAAPGQPVGAAPDHFQQVAQSAPPQVVGQGIAEALRSDQTPPFSQMVGQMFGQANSQQQAGMLNQLLASLGPAALAGIAGGSLARMLPASDGPPQVTPDQAAQLSPEQVQQIAAHAEQQNPSIIDKMGSFYAQHPALVQTIGSAALTIVLAKIANNMRN
jgi:hypothetical protein